MTELRPLDGPHLEDARRLYLEAFPEEERIPFETLISMTSDPDCRFLWMDVDGEFRGIAYVVLSDDLVFLLYLAVSPGHRNEGLGSDAIWLIKCMCGGRRLFVNVEPTDCEAPNMGQRLRRLHFYDRNGFSSQGKFRTPDGMMYNLMSWGGPVTGEEADGLYRTKMSAASGVNEG